jgi:hypothetical protein
MKFLFMALAVCAVAAWMKVLIETQHLVAQVKICFQAMVGFMSHSYLVTKIAAPLRYIIASTLANDS